MNPFEVKYRYSGKQISDFDCCFPLYFNFDPKLSMVK